ncbi:hypothetical protein CspeluHIS016_0300490 [Cutaneotrichosporon spelunceum]|uniref:Uncharacterized protein n=1 Tax=Cutaneotrichosporon spelunceum TaxID=1672016 RepID=A0AAD3TT81_9TREE|nr:hypothetical protein CspeluHIS016_0300490 [Cutaneotrichosporon spelunceum]
MLLQPIVLVTMVPVLAAAAPGPVSNLINRGDKVKCHEFVHNPDRSTWNTSYSLPTQRISHWVDCKVGVNCTIKIVPGIRIGWKYYWDVPDGVTLDLGRYDPASKIGAGMNYVVTTSSSGDYFNSEAV